MNTADMNALTIDRLDQMTPEEKRRFWIIFERQLAFDDGREAQEHLAAGRPIYYSNDQYEDAIIREWPDGRMADFRSSTLMRKATSLSFGICHEREGNSTLYLPEPAISVCIMLIAARARNPERVS